METNKYTCNVCNKKYKTSQSLWNHKHTKHDNIHHISTQYTPVIDNLSTSYQHNDDILKEIPKIKKTDNTLCEYCNNNFSCYSSLHRHLKICKRKNDIEKDKEITEMKKSLDELKNIMLDMMNKKC